MCLYGLIGYEHVFFEMNVFEILYLHGLVMRVEIRRELSLAGTFIGILSSAFSKDGKGFIETETNRIIALGKILGLVNENIISKTRKSGNEVIDDLWQQVSNWKVTQKK